MQKTFLIFYLLVVSIVHAQSNDGNYIIHHLKTNQGLPHDYVTSIISDDLNTKWIGTENGLTKYNGYDFENIKPGKSYSKLNNENIEVIFKDKSNTIWIGTKSGGISSLDITTNTLKNYNHLINVRNNGNLYITAIAADSVGNIWIGTWEDGVFVINYRKNKLLKHFKINTTITSIIADNQSNMWTSSFKTLSKYNIQNGKVENYKFKSTLSDLLFDTRRNKIWIGTSIKNTKLYNFDTDAKKIDSIETGVKTDFYKTLSIDAKNQIWIGTWGHGLYKSNDNLSKFSKIDLVAPNSPNISLNYNTVLKVHHDKNNQIWVATASGGVVQLIEGNKFKNISQSINPEVLNGDFNFTSIYRNSKNIFVGTLNKGLFTGKDLKNLKPIAGIETEKILVLYAHENLLFVGNRSGFHIYDMTLNKVIYSNKKLLKPTAFYIDKDKILYIGTQQKGIAIVPLKDIRNELAYTFYTDISLENFKIENNRISTINEDVGGNIWFGTYSGLHLYNKVKKKFYSKSLGINDKLPSVIINAVAVKDNYLWVGTPSGLVKCEYVNKKLLIKDKVTSENGLNSDFICGITADDQSNIWISTKTEIIKYNELKRSFVSYGVNEGIRTTSFNNRSFYNYENKTIYFGGIDNMSYFDPKVIDSTPSLPQVIFTKLRVNNSIVQYPNDKDAIKIINQSFSYSDKIELNHDNNFFSIAFITNDFVGKSNTKYKYKLEGFQDKWFEIQNQNEINFAGLESGTYKLKVSATRDNQTWSNPTSMIIEIKTSPLKSIWAVLLYLTILAASTYYILKFYKNQLVLRNNLEIARNDKQKEMELSELKLNFFTNISHEFRTPLTLIISPLNELIESTEVSAKVAKKLGVIDRNANRLLNLINQLLDFRKAEYGLLQLNVSNGNIVRFSKEVHLYFNEMAKSKGIKYKFKCAENEINFPFDRNKIEIVLCNLLSNAIKYCNNGDKITLEVAKKEAHCIISVTDTGRGMEANFIDKIFDYFYQIKSAESTDMIGSGIGLSFSKKIIELHHGSINVKSELKHGTEFLIKLPLELNYNESNTNSNFFNTDDINAYQTISNEELVQEPVANLNINAKDISVLIIDDNPDILDYLKDILSDSYHVLLADNGDDGFKIASDEIPDLIVSDVMMPGKDGITLCKELKSQITTSHIPIILLTARSSTVFEIQGLQTGADDYITKPFNPTIIKARIANLLESRKKIRALLLNKIQFEPTAAVGEKETNTESAFINKAILLVENNLQNSSFSIENMVDELNMSQSTLYRKIKSLTGLSLTSFIRSIRLKKAANLILINDLNLSQIAYEVGFNDYKYFKVSFEKQYNCLPSKYKETMTKK